jgi:hypothetical protein
MHDIDLVTQFLSSSDLFRFEEGWGDLMNLSKSRVESYSNFYVDLLHGKKLLKTQVFYPTAYL